MDQKKTPVLDAIDEFRREDTGCAST